MSTLWSMWVVLLNNSYEKQLELKVEQVKDLFKEAELPTGEFLGIRKLVRFNGNRNKMEYTFGDQEKGGELPWNA